jgi:hypothetical protein
MGYQHDNNIDRAKTYTILSGLIFNRMIMQTNFWAGIPDDKKFTNTNLQGYEVKKILKSFLDVNHGIRVSFYYSSFYRRNVVAYVNTGKAMRLHFNTRHHDFILKNNETPFNDIGDKICTLSHETVHIIDNYSLKRFGHGDNSSQGKQDSVPYWFGDYCKKYFQDNFGELENISIYEYLFIN